MEAFRLLRKNVVTYRGRELLLAGKHQFKTLWFRDASFALLTLLEGCKSEIHITRFAEQHARVLIDLYLENLRPDGFGPKCIDVMNPETRTVVSSLHYMFPCCDCSKPYDDENEPMALYVDSRDSFAIDGNLLIALLCFELKYRVDICPRLLKWYDHMAPVNGLVPQTPYSDWQDSVDRSPYTFHINLLYWRTLIKRKLTVEAANLKMVMVATFYNQEDGLFHAMLGEGKTHHVCLEDQLFALDWQFDSKSLFAALKAHPLWTQRQIPGFPTYPNYPNVHWQVKLGGLEHYHDSLYWSWTTAYAGIIAAKFGDREMAKKIGWKLRQAMERDRCIGEVYTLTEEGDLKLFKSLTYESEHPWTWGLAYVIRLNVTLNRRSF